MRNNKGVTLASLTIYIIVLAIILVLLTFISANFTSQISDATNRGKVSNEILNLYSFILSDIKSSNKVVEYSNDFVRFDNDSKYYIKYLGTMSKADSQIEQYEIYKGNIMISDNILDANFDYDSDNNVFSIMIKYYIGNTIVEKSQDFKVGRGY